MSAGIPANEQSFLITHHDVFRLQVLMDNITEMEVKQAFTHARDDFASDGWIQLSKKQMLV